MKLKTEKMSRKIGFLCEKPGKKIYYKILCEVAILVCEIDIDPILIKKTLYL